MCACVCVCVCVCVWRRGPRNLEWWAPTCTAVVPPCPVQRIRAAVRKISGWIRVRHDHRANTAAKAAALLKEAKKGAKAAKKK